MEVREELRGEGSPRGSRLPSLAARFAPRTVHSVLASAGFVENRGPFHSHPKQRVDSYRRWPATQPNPGGMKGAVFSTMAADARTTAGGVSGDSRSAESRSPHRSAATSRTVSHAGERGPQRGPRVENTGAFRSLHLPCRLFSLLNIFSELLSCGRSGTDLLAGHPTQPDPRRAIGVRSSARPKYSYNAEQSYPDEA
jgi:hypothetical protein